MLTSADKIKIDAINQVLQQISYALAADTIRNMNGWAEGYGSGSWRGYKWAFSVYPTDIYGKQTGSIGYTCLALGGSKDAELGTSSGTRFHKYEYKNPQSILES